MPQKELKKVVQTSDASEYIFSIVIPTWNNLEYLKLCINSIKKNSTYKHQIIVHVNEGKDNTAEWLNEQSDIDYTFSAENIGVCYAINYAVTLAKTDYILYLNDDMYVCPNWDKVLKEEVAKVGHPYFFLSSTAIEPRAQSNCSIEKNYGDDLKSFDEQRLLKEYMQLTMKDWQGATWPPNIVHKDIWHLVGGYSIEFSPGMYSDPDFSMKLWKLGVRVFKGCSESRVYHFGSKSVKRVKKNKGYYQFISKWGITSSTLGKYFINRGAPYSGDLKEQDISTIIKLKNKFKQLIAVFE